MITGTLDTRAVEPLDRTKYWSAGIAATFFPVRVDVAGSAFEARLRSATFGTAALGVIQGRPHRVTRTASMVAEGDPDAILLYLVTRGSVVLDQDDRTCLVRPGNLAFHDTSRPSSFEGLEPFEVAMFSVPKRLFGSSLGDLAVHSATDASGSGGRLMPVMVPFLDRLARTVLTVDVSPGEGEAAADMLVPMIRGLFADEGSSTPRVSTVLSEMKGYASRRLHDPSLGPQQLARAHYVSTRYVHKLFAASGTSVSRWIRDQRLDGAARVLQNSPELPISLVASRWGYRNAASFSRAFHERFGCTPSELRSRGDEGSPPGEPAETEDPQPCG